MHAQRPSPPRERSRSQRARRRLASRSGRGRALPCSQAAEQPQRARAAVHAAGGGAAAAVPHLSARPRHLARLHRHQDRPRRRVDRPRELRVPVGRRGHAARAVQHALLHGRRERHQVRARPVAGAAAEPAPAVQDVLPRDRAAAVHRADGAVGDRLLVDLRRAVLDHQLGADEDGPDRPATSTSSASRGTRASRRSPPTSGAACRSSRSRCSPACRRSRRRYYEAASLDGATPLAAVPLRHAAAADADHRGGDDLLGAVHLHRLPADLRADARRPAQRDAPDGDAVVPARDLRAARSARARRSRPRWCRSCWRRSCSAISACSAAPGSRAGSDK